LQTIRKSEVYRTIPVFILSTSKAQYDVTECYKAGANLYMVKPVEFDPLVDMFKNLLNLFHKGNVVTTEIIDLSTDFMY
jgi:two-component system, response regulator